MTLDISTIPELAGVEVQRLPLNAICLSDDMQPRMITSEDAVRRYKDKLRLDKAMLPPVLVVDLSGSNRPLPKTKADWRYFDRDPFVVIDGWHRFRAHQELCIETIPARVIRCSEERARWYAALANMAHGVPLKRGDERRVFRRYIKAGINREADGSPKTYRDIHTDLGGMRSVATLHGWMQKDFPALAAEMAGREEIEAKEPKESKTSWAHMKMQEYATGLVRIARMARKEDKEASREDILGQAWFVASGLGAILDLDVRTLMEAAAANWRKTEEVYPEDMSL